MAQSHNNVEPSEPRAVPIPPRFWWLNRISIGAAILVAALIGVRLWWGHVAEQRLQATIAKYRAAGQPVTLEDFQAWMVTLPDEENGAYFLRQAIRNMRPWAHQYIATGDLLANPQLRADTRAEIERLLDDNARTLALVRKARGLPAADWEINLTSPVASILLPHLSEARELAKTTVLAGLYHHARGNDREVLECAADTLAIARHVGYRQPFLITQLVSIAIEGLACEALVEQIAPDLAISDSPSDDASGALPATRTQVRQLIDYLLADDGPRERFVAGLHGERLLVVDLIESLINRRLGLPGLTTGTAGPPNGLLALLLRPAWKLDAVRTMEHYSVYDDAVVASSGANIESMPEPLTAESKSEQVARFASATWGGTWTASLKGCMTCYYSCLAVRRMTATALALRLYELDHGRRPASLAALVPDYLPTVPTDPYDAAGLPIRYAPDIASPRLYSVGPDGVDDGGEFVLQSGRIKSREKDIPFFLHGDRPVPPPPLLEDWMEQNVGVSTASASSQAVENDQEVEHAERNQDDQQ